jgi:uncharacterized membrane protein
VGARRGYLDWLRGIAVLIMIEAHTIESWTRMADRRSREYGWAMIVGGFGAPIFLFLAGIALSLAAGSHLRKGATAPEAAARMRRRGWQIFAFAFLFRLWTLALSGGSWAKLVKVDILNIMGLAMLAAAVIWGLGRRPVVRAVLLAGAAVAVAMVTPPVRATPLFDPLPDVVEWYLRAPAGRTMFNLFPWAGFLLAGAALGVWLDTARTESAERRLNLALVIAGPALAVAAYAASFLPPLYAQAEFWTSSPTFFFLRLGILLTAVPVAFAIRSAVGPVLADRPLRRSRLETFGVASLFVYWVHVEIVYGLLTLPIHRALPLPWAFAAFAVFTLAMYGLVVLKNRGFGPPEGGHYVPYVGSAFRRT